MSSIRYSAKLLFQQCFNSLFAINGTIKPPQYTYLIFFLNVSKPYRAGGSNTALQVLSKVKYIPYRIRTWSISHQLFSYFKPLRGNLSFLPNLTCQKLQCKYKETRHVTKLTRSPLSSNLYFTKKASKLCSFQKARLLQISVLTNKTDSYQLHWKH